MHRTCGVVLTKSSQLWSKNFEAAVRGWPQVVLPPATPNMPRQHASATAVCDRQQMTVQIQIDAMASGDGRQNGIVDAMATNKPSPNSTVWLSEPDSSSYSIRRQHSNNEPASSAERAGVAQRKSRGLSLGGPGHG